MKRLVTSTAGADSPSRHSAYSIPAPYFPSLTIRAWWAFPVQLLPMVCCQSVSSTIGSGTQARETPRGLSTSTRVTTSNVRHAALARACRNGSTAAPAVAAEACRKALRSMGDLLVSGDGGTA